MTQTDEVVRKYIRSKLQRNADDSTPIDDADVLADRFAVTSLKMIMLMTSICEGEEISLLNFDEEDIAGIKSVGDLSNLLRPHIEENVGG